MLNDCGNCENNNGPCQDHMALIIADHEKSKADARALWADAVLDTWADSVRDEQRGHFSYQIDGRYVCAVKSGGYGHCGQYSGDSAPAARLAAAKKLYPDLPEAVRRELGEMP